MAIDSLFFILPNKRTDVGSSEGPHQHIHLRVLLRPGSALHGTPNKAAVFLLFCIMTSSRCGLE